MDWQLAEALALQRVYGDAAALWVCLQRGSLMLAGDMAGVVRMGEIAAKLDALLTARRAAS